ncbi:MAG: LysR substrate-binding domain-containing protein [Leptothrix sp. (in: b-proteobacteria)]
MRDLDLKTLRLVVAVCDHQNIARAAEQAHIEPSAISKRIAQLEASLGTSLFTRARRGMQPTPAGLALLEHARTILFTIDRIENDMVALQAGAHGRVRLLAAPSAIAEALLDDVAGFMRAEENRHIKVDLEETLTRDVVRALRDGSNGIGVCWDNADFGGITRLPYRRDHLAIAVHPDHPLADRRSLRFEQTLDHAHVGLPPGSSVQVLLHRVAARAGRSIVHRAIVSNFDAAFRVVGANLALSVIPLEIGARLASITGVKVIPLSDAWATRQFVICFRDEQALEPAAQRMVRYLVRAAGAEAAHPGG